MVDEGQNDTTQEETVPSETAVLVTSVLGIRSASSITLPNTKARLAAACWPQENIFNPCLWCRCDIVRQRTWCRALGYFEIFMWTPVWLVYLLRAASEPFVPEKRLNKVYFALSTTGIILSTLSGGVIILATHRKSRPLLIGHIILDVLLTNMDLVLIIFGTVLYFRSESSAGIFLGIAAIGLIPALMIYIYSALVTFGYYTELKARLGVGRSRILPTTAVPSAIAEDSDDDELGLDRTAIGSPLGRGFYVPYYAPFYPAFMMYDYHPFMHNHVHLGLGFHHHHWDYW